MSAANAPAISKPQIPRNEMRCLEPCTFGNLNDPILRLPPVIRAQITVLQQLQNLMNTADAAGLEASVIAELQNAWDVVHAQHQEFFHQADGRFWRHLRLNGLVDEQGVEIKTPGGEINRFAAYYPLQLDQASAA